jgi:predicted metal-dependent enzyme (double-stranded beta helix superfamily)
MLRDNKILVVNHMPFPASGRQLDAGTLIARFAARLDTFGPLDSISPALQGRLLEEVRRNAQRFNARAETGSASGYTRRVLVEVPGSWSLAAIILRPGQQTQPHDHGGWGCAVTVQGIERDRRFSQDAGGNLELLNERDYPPGMGYMFNAVDIHQPVGVDPHEVTVALHFLVEGSWGSHTHP